MSELLNSDCLYRNLRVYRVDTSVLLVFQLDLMNLACALTEGFAKDIGTNQDTINLGTQLMFMGIIALERFATWPFSV